MKTMLCFVLALVCAAGAIGATQDERQAFEEWKLKLIRERKEEWLPLAGLFWLKPGETTFGTDPGNGIVFPKGPAKAGTFVLSGQSVTLKLEPGVHARISGKQITGAQLESGGNPTTVEMGSLRFKAIVRGERIGIRLKDVASEAVRNYAGPAFFPWRSQYRITARWIPSDGKRTVDVPNVLGDVIPTPIAGIAVFPWSGQELRLTAIIDDDPKELFFIFNDLTSKTETYPGGRFLKAAATGDGVTLDFNRAYSPPCAVTAYATCPLAPKDNRLPVVIEAGEKYDRASHH
jgi:uncharacterized protein (DUF1684 family)